MAFDLVAALPLLIPKAIEWAEQRAAEISATGAPLPEDGLALARLVGVASPERIRLSFVDRLPLPADPMLREAAIQTGLLGPNMIGLTLGHCVYIRNGYSSPRLLSHEFRHVHQYEQAGSIAAYLPRYLQEIVQYGYADSPYEVDARDHETGG
jgi:hypothetical protein